MSRHHRGRGLAKGRDWERIRRQVLERDAYRCRECGKAGRLEVHHLLHLDSGGTNALENLRTLCRSCHIEAHKRWGDPDWEALLAET